MDKQIDASSRIEAKTTQRAFSATRSRASTHRRLRKLFASMIATAMASLALGACGGSSDPQADSSENADVVPAQAESAQASPATASASGKFTASPAPANQDATAQQSLDQFPPVSKGTIPMWSDVFNSQN